VGRSGLVEDSHEFQNYTTITHGPHTIKFGVRIRGDILNSTTPVNFNGTYTFASFSAYQIMEQGLTAGLPFSTIQAMGGGPTQFSISTGNPLITSTMVDVGAYVQDDWRIRPNLTISAGLRYEGQTNIHDWHDFGPRASFAWAPKASSGNPKFVIRGGFGMFYIRFPNQDELYTDQYNGVNQQSYLVRDPDFFSTATLTPAELGLTPETAVQFITAANLRTPYLMQTALSVERQLARRTTLSINWTDTRGVHQFVTSDINAPLPDGLRPLPNMGDIFEYQSDGLLKQMQLITRINTQVSGWLSLFGAYVWNTAHSNTDGTLCATSSGCGTSEPVNQYDLSQEWSRSSLDISDRMFMGGTVMLPWWKVQLAPFMTATSGVPFDITTGSDYLGNGVLNARPSIASGPGPGIIDTPYGYLNPNPLPGQPLLPRNFGTGPAQFNLNLRLSKTWGFGSTKFSGPSGGARAASGGGGGGGGRGGGGGGRGGFGGGGGQRGGGASSSEHRYNLTLSISARNLINHVNDAAPVGVIGSPFFLQSTETAGGFAAEQTPTNNRRIDVQLRFQF
jgi:uncharacterized membrane protein YgcG